VLRAEQKLQGIDVSVVCPGEISTPLLTYEREHGIPITEVLNAFAGVLSVEQAVAGILHGIRRRQLIITPGLLHWVGTLKLAKAFGREQARSRS